MRFKEAPEEEEKESEDWIIGWEENKYEPSPMDMSQGFVPPEEIVVPGFGAENQWNRDDFPEDSDDLPDFEPSPVQEEEEAGTESVHRPRECPAVVMAQDQTPPKEEGGLEVVNGRAEGGTEDMPFRHAGEPRGDSHVPIGQIRQTTGLMVKMVVQGVRLQAVVDTEAEFSELSIQVYKELNLKSFIKQYVTSSTV